VRALITRTPGAPIPEALNGIAYNEAEGTFYLTGKYWPKVFEVQFINAQ
jgi:glutamine cyclotransferase